MGTSQGEPVPEPASSSSSKSDLDDLEGTSSSKRPRDRETGDATEGRSPGGEVPKRDMIANRLGSKLLSWVGTWLDLIYFVDVIKIIKWVSRGGLAR